MAVVTALAVLSIFFLSSAEIRINLQNITMEQLTDFIGNPLLLFINYFSTLMIFLSVVAAADQIPSMLQKGRADFYLSKPLSRANLVLYKTCGTLVSYGGLILFCCLFLTAAIFIKFHFIEWNVVNIFLLQIIAFFIWLSIITFTGILFGSTNLSIMIVFIVWLFQFGLSWTKILDLASDAPAVLQVLKFLYFISPKTSEISNIAYKLALNKPVISWYPLTSSIVFSIVLFSFSIVVLKSKDY